jgi:hypothetical protein
VNEDGEQLSPVYLTVAVRTSRGAGPGVVWVPLAEAAALVRDRRGVHGTQPPANFHCADPRPGR